MAKTFRPYSLDQLLLLPPSLREWLPADHPVYLVNDLVETLDLEPILSSYGEERGFPPYHPVLMTKLIVYGYVRGMRSARKMQSACLEDVAFRILAAGQAPDFRTIATFRARHLEALEGAFAQVLHLCREAGLVKLGHVAVILLAPVSQTAADQGQLLPLVEQVTLDQGVAPQMVRADAGYWKESDVELLEINDIEPFVAPKRVKHSQWREMKAPRGRIPTDLDRKERMLRKLSTQRGRAE